MATRKILAIKLAPTVVIGNHIFISTRNFKIKGKPPYKIDDCPKSFKEFITDDTTDVTTLCSFKDDICGDLLEEHILGCDKNSLPDESSVILVNENDSINAKRVRILTTDLNLHKKFKVVNKSAKHKAIEYVAKDFTSCGIFQEEENIFKAKYFDQAKYLKKTEIPKNGFFEIELKK